MGWKNRLNKHAVAATIHNIATAYVTPDSLAATIKNITGGSESDFIHLYIGTQR